ncbi:MAG: HAMP domain-containing sensor histidine kinase [Planctomycetota bacterium]
MRKTLPLLLGAALLVLVWSASAWILRGDLERWHEDELRLGQALTDMAEAQLARTMRGARYRPEELEESLQNLVQQAPLQEVTLWSGAGERWKHAARETGQPGTRFEREVTVLQPRGFGFGAAGRGEPLPDGPLRLEVRLPLGPARAATRRAWWRMGSMALLGSAAVILAGWTLGGFLQRRELAHRLAQSEQRLQHLRTLERMGAGLAHETKNPLGLVRAQAQRVQAHFDEPEQVRALSGSIIEQSDRILARLNEFLELSHRPVLRRQQVDLAALVGEICDLLQVEAQAQDVRLTFERSAQDDGRGLSADPERLRQVAMNLILNALQICPPGSHVRVAAAARDGAPDFIVDDDGPGVAPELADDLFQPYVSARPGGTGLGLAISQAIAREHGWHLYHEGLLPHGSRFGLRGEPA